MKLVKAKDLDNEQLLTYFAKSEVQGSIGLKLRRMFNFFNQYRIQSDDYVTYLLLNKKDEIEAMATLLFKEAWIQGEKQTICFATDLRVSKSRRAILQWSQHFLPVLEEERQKRNCTYTFSVLATSQRQAYNALIRPRNLRRQMPRYYQYRRFELISLHGLWPFHRPPLPGIQVVQATESDLDALADYISLRSKEKPLYYFNSKEEFVQTLDRWRDLYLENFLLAKDHEGNIIGCGAPWSPAQIQRVYVSKYSAQAKNLQDFVNFMSLFRMTHTLPKAGQELSVRHMCFLNADNPDILYSILYRAFKQAAKNETILYPHFEDHLQTMPPKAFISARKQYSLYCVLAPSDSVPEFIKPTPFSIPPEFESAFL